MVHNSLEIRSIRYIIVTLSKIPKGSVNELQGSDDADIKFELKKISAISAVLNGNSFL